jgi:hypothetical protein
VGKRDTKPKVQILPGGHFGVEQTNLIEYAPANDHRWRTVAPPVCYLEIVLEIGVADGTIRIGGSVTDTTPMVSSLEGSTAPIQLRVSSEYRCHAFQMMW